MKKKDIYFILIIFTLPFFFLSETLLSKYTFFFRDLTYLFHPWRSLATEMIQSGEFPLWNSYEMGGMPFLANCQSSILYPFTLFFYFFDFVIGLKLFTYFHYMLACLGFYLMSRKLDFSPFTSFTGSILFAYNGYFLTRLEFLSVLGTLIWFPWMVLLLLNKFKNNFNAASIFLGITFCYSLFAGYPQIFLLQIIALTLFGLILNTKKNSELILNLFTAGFILLAVGIVQWLPTIELQKFSIRGGNGISFEEAVSYSLPKESLMGLIYPYKILHHSDRFTGEKFFWIWSAWCGIAAIIPIIFSFFSKQKKTVLYLFLILIISILWSMGNYWPWFQWFYKNIFLIRLFRYPPVILYFYIISIAFLVLIGLKNIYTYFSYRTSYLSVILISCILTTELWSYSRNILPTIIPQYFHYTFNSIHSLQKEKVGRVMLSPKVDRERKLPGLTDFAATIKFRAFLFDLTNLPYQIKSIAASGEPLTLNSFNYFYTQLTHSPSLTDARPFFNYWNITHFLTSDVLDNSWEKVSEDENVKVYKNSEAFGESFAISKEEQNTLTPKDITPPLTIEVSNMHTIANFQLKKDSIVIFNTPYFPGWKAYQQEKNSNIKTNPLKLFQHMNYFNAVYLNEGLHTIYLVYQPFSWKIALILCLLSIGVIYSWGIRKLKFICNENNTL